MKQNKLAKKRVEVSKDEMICAQYKSIANVVNYNPYTTWAVTMRREMLRVAQAQKYQCKREIGGLMAELDELPGRIQSQFRDVDIPA